MIGTYGPVKFIVTDKTQRTFDEFTRSIPSRWAVHDVHLGYPVAEFLGPGQSKITFTMYFDVSYGLRPLKELHTLADIGRKGKRFKLVIGGRSIGAGYWYIDNQEQAWTHIDNRGNIIRASVQLSLSEYV